jgi:hypothetical protein
MVNARNYNAVKESPKLYAFLVGALLVTSIVGGYKAGVQPTNEWRFFSWHPLLMNIGFVGLAGIGAITKKLGGYANTHIHLTLGWLGITSALAGIYVIYTNKENNGFEHLKTPHAKMGAMLTISTIGLGMAGGIFLHPDFGMDRTNPTIRVAHKVASRVALIGTWFTAIIGLMQLSPNDTGLLAMYAVPLILLVPYVLM